MHVSDSNETSLLALYKPRTARTRDKDRLGGKEHEPSVLLKSEAGKYLFLAPTRTAD